MKIERLQVAGFAEALRGIALNKLQPLDSMTRVADRLSQAATGSHKKFLRMMQVWIEIEAPLYWWCEFDTYKIGVTRNSSSIMHKPLEHLSFHEETQTAMVHAYEKLLAEYKRGGVSIDTVKANTPAGVVYKSVVNLNYQVLQTIYNDRRNHRLQEWQEFCKALEQFPHKHWIVGV